MEKRIRIPASELQQPSGILDGDQELPNHEALQMIWKRFHPRGRMEHQELPQLAENQRMHIHTGRHYAPERIIELVFSEQ